MRPQLTAGIRAGSYKVECSNLRFGRSIAPGGGAARLRQKAAHAIEPDYRLGIAVKLIGINQSAEGEACRPRTREDGDPVPSILDRIAAVVMDHLWSPWRYAYITSADKSVRAGIPEA